MIYVGSFIHMTHQEQPDEEDRRYGEFNLIVSAESQEKALDRFRDRIAQVRAHRSLLEGSCRIYLIRLLSLDVIPSDMAAMFDFTSVAGDPIMPHIACASPNDSSDGCHIFAWDGDAPEIDGRHSPLFMTFAAPGE